MIERTRELVLEIYNKENGYRHDAEVIYGDTDSVMVKFGVDDIKEAMELGQEAAQRVTQEFRKPIKLEFEKVYCPYLLMNKKRYAGLLYTNPNKHDKIDAKGIETVRRDNCQLAKDVVDTCLNKILIERSYTDAIEYCKGVISDLLQNRVDLSLLVITKGIGKKTKENEEGKEENYKAKQAHIELAQRMKKRDESCTTSVGDRIAYVMIKGVKGAKAYEKSEDPLYVLENNLPIDYNHYLEHQLKQPLIRIFEPILGNPEQILLTGEHMRSIYMPKVAATSGLGRFVSVKTTCLACKLVIKEGVLCRNCAPKTKQFYIERRLELNRLEKNYADLWVQCQRCQGSLHQDILCQR